MSFYAERKENRQVVGQPPRRCDFLQVQVIFLWKKQFLSDSDTDDDDVLLRSQKMKSFSVELH